MFVPSTSLSLVNVGFVYFFGFHVLTTMKSYCFHEFVNIHMEGLETFVNLLSAMSFQILQQLKHENIIEMLDAFESDQEFCVVTEIAQLCSSPTACFDHNIFPLR